MPSPAEQLSRPDAIFDVDGTVFKSSLLETTIEAAVQAGLFEKQAFARAHEIRRAWQDRNAEGTYLAYLSALVGGFTAQIAGVRVVDFETVVDTMLVEHNVRRFRFPRELMRTLAVTHNIVAISGSPDIIVSRFLADLPVATVHGSQYEVVDGVFTGVARSVGSKATIQRARVTRGDSIQAGSFAAGDTMSDADVMDTVDAPLAFNASRTLTDYARAKGYPRAIETKDNVVVLQRKHGSADYEEVSPEDYLDQLRAA